MKKHFFIFLGILILFIQRVNAQNETGTNFPALEIRTAVIDTAVSDSASAVKKAAPGTLSNTFVPNSVTIDKTKSVGEIPMSSTVSPAGAVTYNVPIVVYPGSHGMQPELSLSYNSQSGNGILGAGWSIGGLSSVMRGNRSIYYDGQSQGLSMTKNDAFYLDGMRLIKQSETTTQIKYESEQGNIKATANLNGTAVKYFDVYFPNGRKGTYGYTTNSSTNYLEYPLTALSDLYGNSITYTYTYADNHYRISKISYANASVEFQYQSTARTDVTTVYSGGLKIKEDQLLQKISCKYGSTTLRNYNLSYTVQKNTSLLTEIGYSASDGSSFNPLKFYYGENNTATIYTREETLLQEWYPFKDKNEMRVSKGKFDYGTDNDGLIALLNMNSYYQNTSSKKFENKYTGTEKILLYTGLNSSIAAPMPNLTTEAGFVDILCANVDGKGEDEVVKVNNVVSGSNDQLTFTIYGVSAISGLGRKGTYTFNFPTVVNSQSVQPKFYYAGDFNGDGKTEILAVSCNQPFGATDRPTKCYLFNLESNTKLYEGSLFSYNYTFLGSTQTNADEALKNSDRLYVFDYDGDGKSDICLINTTGTYIYTFDVSGSTYLMQQVACYTGLKRADLDGRELMIGEFNGDGKPDFLLSAKVNDSDWSVYYSMGNGQFDKVALSFKRKDVTYSYFLQDVNSDGLTDLIEYNTLYIYTYLAGNGKLFPFEAVAVFDTNSIPVPTNINNRNYFHQIVALGNNGKAYRYSYQRNDTKEILLTGSVSSLGVVNKNYYRMLSNASASFYTKGTGAVFPYENFQGPLFVPEAREQYFQGARNEYLNYMYENAVIHKQGRGFCGFGKITTCDNIRGRTQSQKFDPYNFSVLTEDDSPTAKTTNTWSVSVASDKKAKVRLTNQSVQDKLRGITIASTSTYDDYGNPLTESTSYGDGIGENVTNKYNNNTDESGYLLGFLINQRKTICNHESLIWPGEYSVSTNDSKGQPTAITLYSNGIQKSYETYAYDSKGNPTSRGVKAYSSSNTLTTNYVYDDYGRLTKETDPLGFSTTYEYNASNGSLSSTKNHKGQATTFAYDAFFRQIYYTYPEGTHGVTEYSWNAAGTNGLYCIYHCETGHPWTKTYYDAMGRETVSSGLNFDGAEPRTEKQYDSYGRLSKVSLPYTGTVASYWNTYQYDNYDRLTSVSEASGRLTSYAYSGNSVTTTEDGVASKQTFDNYGHLMSVTDPSGTVVYNLRPDGQLSSIVAPDNITTSFGYSIDRRSSITDPSAGTRSCTYNSEGDIATETDANNKKISYEYDTYRRLTKKVRPEFTTAYAYNADGLLESETSDNGTSTTYTYDTYGRQQKERETVVDGKWLEKTYSYGASYVQSIQYASQNETIVTENYAYAYGHLSEIKLNGTTSIWKVNDVNVFGQTKGESTGVLDRSYYYNAYGLPTGRLITSSVQDQTYSFDAAKGNLTYRKDNLKNLQENFTYDNLNRLTGYAGKTASYNANGNITGKTDVGTFQYNTTGKPYALSGVTSPTNLVPQRNQTITYTSFQRPASIADGEYTATFTYNSSEERVKMELKKNGVKELNRYYISDCYEIDDRAVGGVKEKLYLGGDFYTAAAVYVKEGSGSWALDYICRDYLGSITHVVNRVGSVTQELSYDAWGQLRNPANQTVYTPGTEPELFLGRGYTGHEHLPWFGLINMNARLYDAALGRFLSPDPFVQNPLLIQNFNRYSYAVNNPLCYTDPTGKWFGIDDLLAAAIGGVVNLVVNACQGNIHNVGQGFAYFGVGAAGSVAGLYGGPAAAGAVIGAGNSFITQGFGSNGNWSWGNIKSGDVFMSGLIGAGTGFLGSKASGFLSPYTSTLFSNVGGQAIQQALTQGVNTAATGFVIGTGLSLANGESFGNALKAGGQNALMGFAIGSSTGMISGIRSAYKDGENPWTGNDKATQQIKLKSVGAQGTSIKKIDDNYLKQQGIDAEAIKYEYLGNKAPISRLNLYQTPSGQIFISDGKNVQIPTDYFIK